ncbi:RNA polymerase Rpb1 domain 3 [Arabidopsis thaliana x Arabidopsis arenosa]|uniref:DNA-directed RNA polymerase subunit n=2 Tax=Arabidopsis TaxID=3701 RepID=A0A178UF03_ARATH|nr:RNA polymerase Rpb1 domain 3 [Arabidopsis thaliana x Arabidopsis arenosa]OAO92388.1 NRPC1 [Arabidopsis thaliana]
METKMEIEFTKKPYIEDVGPLKIKSINFSVLSDLEVMKAAEVQVWNIGLYDHSFKPYENGLLDPRMGPPNKKSICTTCEGNFQNCPGHYGYLKLDLPVYNVGYFNFILDILKCICKRCSNMLLDEKLYEDHLRKMRNPRMEPLKKTELAKVVVKKCSTMASQRIITCKKCGYLNGMVKKIAAQFGIGISHDRSKIHGGEIDECKSAISHTKQSTAAINPLTYVLDPNLVLGLFKRMSDKDCELLYIAYRPENLIITCMLVPPLSIRPSVMIGGIQSNENDLTARLKQIILGNASLHKILSQPTSSPKNMQVWDTVQIEVARYINSEVRGCQNQPEEHPLSGILQRLKGKGGRFRANLSGKRVEFTGRTVISPDPNLKITEVGIPILMAQILTFPECVSRHNIEKLRQCVRNGPNKYPGARNVRYPDGSSRTLVGDYRKRIADELAIGCIVDRHLQEGDVVLFNRQPSLHRMSIMCHRARIMPWRTLRFNESVCNPYNADFDGDEMNMHVPQTEEARTEAITLMGVQNNLCTPKNGEILVASTQDFLTSSFLITRKDTFYDRAAFSLICSYMGDGMDSIDLPTPTILKPIELWTGKQIFSVLLRPNASIRVYVTLNVKEKNFKKGEHGFDETMCINDGWVYFRNSELISGQLGKATLGNGNKDGLYSILLRDYNSHAAAVCMNRLAKLSARWIGIHGFSIGIDDVQPGEELSKERKDSIQFGYDQCHRKIEEFNRGNLQLKAGLDGAKSLEAEITGILNTIREATGKACMSGLHWRNSPLIMSQCGSKGSPINISQMVACVGQQTVNGHRAPDGFIDRSLPHFPRMSKSPAAKGFVANSFYSGLTATEFFFHTMGGREGLVDTAVKTASTGYMSRRLMKALEDLLVHYDNTVRNASGCILQFTYGDDGMDPALMEGKDGAPLNFNRLFLKVQATCPPRSHHTYLSSEELSQKFEEELVRHDKSRVCTDAFVKSLREFVSLLGVKSASPPQVLYKASGVTDKQLEVFVNICVFRYREKKIEAGTAIGTIGAQSIGEPGTQMTLKTFHFAGVASMNITQGVPRINEIINASKNISTPVISAELENPLELTSARWVKGRIEKTTLGQVAESIEVLMTSTSASVRIILDNKIIEEACLSITPWSVKNSILKTPRIKLNDNDIRVLDTGLDITPVVDKSRAHFNLHNLKNVLPNIIVNGIKTVERVVVAEDMDKSKQIDGKTKWKLFVEGTNLLAVMGTPGINGRTTTSNNVVEVSKTLGIEAARTTIIDEIGTVMGNHGMSIDIRHMMLLADVMTYRGEVLGIQRTGIQKMDKSVLMQASFERTGDHLFSAAASGKVDNIEGVTECVIMGIPMKLGTGILKVLQRTDDLPKLKYGPDPIIS